MRAILLILPVVASLVAGPAAPAQVEARFTVRSAVPGERVQYVISVTREGADAEKEIAPPAPPAGDGYSIRYVAPPQDSRSQQMSIINGEVRRSTTVRTTFLYELVPNRPGVVTVPAFPYEILGRTVTVRAASLRVESEAEGNKYVDVAVSVEPKVACVNQPIVLRIELLSRRQFLTGRSALSLSAPWFDTLEGFGGDKPEPAQQQQRNAEIVEIEGKPYNFVSKESTKDGESLWQLTFEREIIPLKAGRFTFDPAMLQGNVAESVGRDFFGNLVATSTARVVKASAPLTIEVRDLPETGRPASFTNAVGTYEVKLRAGPTDIKAGDPVTVTLAVAGRGSIESIKPPKLEGFEGFTLYEPETKVETGIGGDPRQKRLTVSWLAIPKSNEVKAIPAVAFSWFDPAASAFKTESVGPLDLKITGKAADSPLVVGNAASSTKRDIEMRKVILADKADPGTLLRPGETVFGAGFVAALLVPVLSLAATAAIVRRKARLSGDVSLKRRVVASKAARERLAEAEAIRDGAGDFAGALSRALSGFIADKLSLPPASVAARSVRETLVRAEVDEALAGEVEAALDDFDSRRFGLGPEDAGARAKDLERVGGLIRSLDRRLR